MTPAQEDFCQAFVRLGDSKKAYLAAKPHVTGKTARTEASKLTKNPNIQARIAELRDAIKEKTALTVESLIDELVADREKARENNKYGEAIKATESIAKLAGLWVDKNETTMTMRPDEARALIGQLAAKYLPAGSP